MSDSATPGMSTEPPPRMAAPPTVPGTAPAHRAPAAWPTVVGTIGCIIGGFGVLQHGVAALSYFFVGIMEVMFSGMPGAAGAQMEAMKEFSGLHSLVGLISMLMSAALIVGSVLLIKRRPAGARLLWVWAWVRSVMALVSAGVGYMIQVAQVGSIPSTAPGAMPTSFMNLMVGFGVLVTLVTLLCYPVFMVIWLTRRGVKAEIAGWSGTVAKGPGSV